MSNVGHATQKFFSILFEDFDQEERKQWCQTPGNELTGRQRLACGLLGLPLEEFKDLTTKDWETLTPGEQLRFDMLGHQLGAVVHVAGEADEVQDEEDFEQEFAEEVGFLADKFHSKGVDVSETLASVLKDWNDFHEIR
jgi:hypothetical protein